MKACDTVLVTVEIQDKMLDMELPAFLPAKELCEKIQETFCILYPLQHPSAEILHLACDGEAIPPQKHLASCGIWDGSVLQAVTKGVYFRGEHFD